MTSTTATTQPQAANDVFKTAMAATLADLARSARLGLGSALSHPVSLETDETEKVLFHDKMNVFKHTLAAIKHADHDAFRDNLAQVANPQKTGALAGLIDVFTNSAFSFAAADLFVALHHSGVEIDSSLLERSQRKSLASTDAESVYSTLRDTAASIETLCLLAKAAGVQGSVREGRNIRWVEITPAHILQNVFSVNVDFDAVLAKARKAAVAQLAKEYARHDNELTTAEAAAKGDKRVDKYPARETVFGVGRECLVSI